MMRQTKLNVLKTLKWQDVVQSSYPMVKQPCLKATLIISLLEGTRNNHTKLIFMKETKQMLSALRLTLR